jgi:hypothetical protein
MNAIEQLIRKKLTLALDEEKKRIAAKLLEVMTTPKKPATSDMSKKQGAANSVKAAQARVQALQSKAATAKDPVKFKATLQVAKDKLKAAQDRQRLANTK